MQRASFWKLISLNFCWLGLSFMWNSLHVILLPAALLAYVNPDAEELDPRIAYRDRAGHRDGHPAAGRSGQRPLVLAVGPAPAVDPVGDAGRPPFPRECLAWPADLPALAIGYIGLQFSSNFAHGAMQGLMPDVIAADQLGRGSAFKTVLDMIGLVVASLFIGRMLPPDSAIITGPVGLVIAVLIISTVVTLVFTRERGSQVVRQQEKPVHPFREILRVDFRRNTRFAWLIVSRLVFLLGVYGIQSFAQYFVRDTLPNANPVKLTGDLMALIVLGLVFFSLIAGFLCDRFGTRPVHAAASVLVTTGSLAMILAHSPGAVLGCGLVIGSGIGLFLTANWTLSNQLAPAAEAGMYLGLTNLATAGAGALSRLFGPVIDLVNLSAPGRYLGYPVLFLASAIFAVIGFLLMSRVFQVRDSSPELEPVQGQT